MIKVYAATDDLLVTSIKGHIVIVETHDGEIEIDGGELFVGDRARRSVDLVRKNTAAISGPSAINLGLLRSALDYIGGEVTLHTFQLPEADHFGLIFTNAHKSVVVMPMHAPDGAEPHKPCWDRQPTEATK